MIQSRPIIIGGGIHGVSIAYYLSKRGYQPIIIEKTAIASAASGKAGGFLARDWGYGDTVQLHQKSYDLHEQLALELQIQSYRKVTTLSVDGNKSGKNIANWLDRKASSVVLSMNTAQVTPLELTTKMLEAATSAGTEVIIGTVTNVLVDNGYVKSVNIDNQRVIEANQVIITLGPWSGVNCEDWFGVSIPMEGVKSTSLLFKNLEPITTNPFALFCNEDEYGCHLEFYPRPNGDLYVCGCGGSDYVSGDRLRANGDCASSDLVYADPKRVDAATKSFKSMSSLGDHTPDITQACMRPCPPDALPIMGEIPGVNGAFISAGHNCWGILWAPISGFAMSELICDGRCKVINIEPFSPLRFNLKKKDRGKKLGSTSVGEQW
eukprot:gene24498-31900_t